MNGTVLKLLVPEQLPPNGPPLSEAASKEIRKIFSQLRSSFEAEDPDDSRTLLEELLKNFAEPDSERGVVKDEEPISNRSIINFDTYFEVEHIVSTTPAWSLIQSIAESGVAFYDLLSSCREVSPEDIALQRAGFLSYLDLLERQYLTSACP